ncbi:MAG: hypothetical protein K1X53_09030 [Candidatus Sumerlaeaceae bacterium]|nr:hypothetical protein [Candidatus Sumerlaeaceae bacterium]
MWATFGHQTVGNFLIGIFEGLLVARFFKIPTGRAVGILILANYVSGISGFILANLSAFWANDGNPLSHLGAKVALAFLVTYITTLILEWPFCYWMASKPDRARKATIINFTAQSCSYLLIVLPFLLYSSNLTLLSNARIESNVEFAKKPVGWVYYLSRESGDVCRIRTDGTGQELITRLQEEQREGVLVWHRDALSEPWKLLLVNGWGPDPYDVMTTVPVTHKSTERASALTHTNFFMASHRALDLQDTSTLNRWAAGSFGWATPGLRFWQTTDKLDDTLYFGQGIWKAEGIGLETVGNSWRCGFPTVLPSGQIVCQFGDNIFLFDPETRQLGFLATGENPAVIVPDG